MERSRAAHTTLLTLLLASCSSVEERPPVQRLPFHVSVLPIELSLGQTAVPTGLQVDGEVLRERLAQELGGDCFVAVSTPGLPARAGSARAPEGLPGDPAGWSRDQREEFWLHDAAARGADILALASLELDPVLRSHTNGRFWLEIPLFLIGGPFCYWVDDRTYELDAVLRVRLFDAQLLREGAGDLRGGAALLADVRTPYEGTALDFLDRVGGRAGDWALSFLVPSGLLAKNTPAARAAVLADLSENLAVGLESVLQAEQLSLLRPSGVNFFLRADDLRATRVAGGTIDVRGVVRFRPDARVESLKGFRLSAGDTQASYRFGEPRSVDDGAGGRVFVYELAAGVTPSSIADRVQVQIFHGGGDDRSRTFTLALDAAAAGSPAP